jgi:hypothetical protein
MADCQYAWSTNTVPKLPTRLMMPNTRPPCGQGRLVSTTLVWCGEVTRTLARLKHGRYNCETGEAAVRQYCQCTGRLVHLLTLDSMVRYSPSRLPDTGFTLARALRLSHTCRTMQALAS